MKKKWESNYRTNTKKMFISFYWYEPTGLSAFTSEYCYLTAWLILCCKRKQINRKTKLEILGTSLQSVNWSMSVNSSGQQVEGSRLVWNFAGYLFYHDIKRNSDSCWTALLFPLLGAEPVKRALDYCLIRVCIVVNNCPVYIYPSNDCSESSVRNR